jgi:eukaryotic-like serine/threonine-protein kinase
MTEHPPENVPPPQPMKFDVNRKAASGASRQASAVPSRETSLPVTRDLQREMIGTTLGGRYVIRGILGEGGMGMVYEAEHLGLGRAVAVKVLNPTQARKKVAVKRFQQEARAAGAIGHPNICEVYDMGLLDDGSPFLVMEKLVGETLADRIAASGGMAFEDVVDVVIQVLSGLIAAHEKGILHRDIKPENIFLARRPGCPAIAKILDFGVSKMMPQFLNGEEQLDLTRTGMVMGTPYYMSPEQARGERNLDGRVDVYACGVMMYEALAGRRPFLAPNYNALLLSIINTAPKALRELRPSIPRALEVVIMRGMAKSRDDRYSSAMHFMRELQALEVATHTQQRPPPPPSPAERARAQVLGGARPRRDDGYEREEVQDETRVELRRSTGGGRSYVEPSGDSVEIPIDISEVDAPSGEGRSDDDEMPTEIFRPHHAPRDPRVPAPSRGQARPPEPRYPAPVVEHVMPSTQAPASDDWDAETIVRRPDLPLDEGEEIRADLRRAAKKVPVNFDETVKLADRPMPGPPAGAPVDFDETMGPRRRRR